MRTTPRRRTFLAAAVAATLTPAVRPLRACLWDYDTLAAEARGLPDVVRAVTGRFDRNPPLFYVMRLERATARVASDPDDLDAYDDAGVACDRIGLGDDALAWMDRKRARLDAATAAGRDVSTHRYRLLANAGTFRAHRWFRNGADRSRLDDLSAARDLIAEAVALNPNAHFGRESFQLRFLEWVLHAPRPEANASRDLPTFLGNDLKRSNAHEAVVALTGLVTLGNAWESVDVFHALTRALDADDGRTSLAMLARWRCEELIDKGKITFFPGFPKGAALRGRLRTPFEGVAGVGRLSESYNRLRKEADDWHEARKDYMNERLRAGLHPDTDPHFWDGYHDPGPPPLDLPDEKAAVPPVLLAPSAPGDHYRETAQPIGFLLGVGGAATTALFLLRRSFRRRSELAADPARGGQSVADPPALG